MQFQNGRQLDTILIMIMCLFASQQSAHWKVKQVLQEAFNIMGSPSAGTKPKPGPELKSSKYCFNMVLQLELPNIVDIVSMFQEIFQQAGSSFLCYVHPENWQFR